MYFKTFTSENMINKKRFSLTSMNKKSFLQNAPKHEEILQKSTFFFNNNLRIHRVIICFTVCLMV